jgi:hypothetical protein
LNPFDKALLLGAGFTKNFGGFLASEMWATIFNQKEVQSSWHLRQKMLGPGGDNYEDLYAEIVRRDSEVPRADSYQFEMAVNNAYLLLDRVIAAVKPSSQYRRVHQEFICKFMPQDERKGFIFTVNQDLWFERLFDIDIGISLPGIGTMTSQQRPIFGGRLELPISIHDLIHLPVLGSPDTRLFDPDKLTPLSLVRLHGSHNFMSIARGGKKAIVLGRDKDRKIAEEPLLSQYLDLFKDVIGAGTTRLLVIGYGFRDKHINEALQAALEKHTVKLYVMNPQEPASWRLERLQQGNDWAWHGLSGYFPYSLSDLFPNPQDMTLAWEDLQRNFFNV